MIRIRIIRTKLSIATVANVIIVLAIQLGPVAPPSGPVYVDRVDLDLELKRNKLIFLNVLLVSLVLSSALRQSIFS